jgi:hypothetical protein
MVMVMVMVMVGSDPGPRIRPSSPLAELSLPFRNAACTGQSGVETVIPLRAAASGASLKL